MKQLKMFAVYDSITQSFAVPFCAVNSGDATRILAAGVNDPQTNLHHSTEDYSLFYLGHYDQDSGVMYPLKAPERVISAIEVKLEQVAAIPDFSKLSDEQLHSLVNMLQGYFADNQEDLATPFADSKVRQASVINNNKETQDV